MTDVKNLRAYVLYSIALMCSYNLDRSFDRTLFPVNLLYLYLTFARFSGELVEQIYDYILRFPGYYKELGETVYISGAPNSCWRSDTFVLSLHHNKEYYHQKKDEIMEAL